MIYTYSPHIKRQLSLHAVKSVPERGDITAHDEEHYPGIVELVAPFRDLGRVVAQGVVRGAHPQTYGRPGEEAPEDEDIGGGGRLVARVDDGIKQIGGHQEEDGS